MDPRGIARPDYFRTRSVSPAPRQKQVDKACSPLYVENVTGTTPQLLFRFASQPELRRLEPRTSCSCEGSMGCKQTLLYVQQYLSASVCELDERSSAKRILGIGKGNVARLSTWTIAPLIHCGRSIPPGACSPPITHP